MTQSKQQTGSQGEALAAEYLTSKGCTIVNQNWRTSKGEIDIIAQDGDTLVFVEVRTRHAPDTSFAFESVNNRKQAKLRQLAYDYLNLHNLTDSTWRIDVIAVALRGAAAPVIDHVEDALGW